ncbi:protein AKTIP homolog [Montipora foliosa]|uniref:protein AKTIP homolog n=1 Tax=Montipora foliosa TaxID=591990 RepID=UPI0035F13409
MLNVTHHLRKKLFLGDLDETQSGKSQSKQPPGSKYNGMDNGMQSQSNGDESSPRNKRKSLPPVPSPEEEKSMNLSVARQRSPGTNPSQVRAYGPYFLEYTLMAEYNQLRIQRLPGVYVLPAAKSPLIWYGVIFIRMGSYQDGIFKFVMTIPENFPDGECPRFIFKPPVYHPVVNIETGELDVKRAFPKWRRNINHLFQVLLYARRIFYKIDLKDPLNAEAARLYDNDRDAFKQNVNVSLRSCLNELHLPLADDPHAIRFVELTPDQHDEIKNQIIENQSKPECLPTANAHKSGLSWMKKGSNQIFSQQES